MSLKNNASSQASAAVVPGAVEGPFKLYEPIDKFHGRRVMITGANNEIGKEIVLLFALEGAHISLLCTPEDEENLKGVRQMIHDKVEGVTVSLFPVNMSSGSDVKQAINIDLHGELDTLILNHKMRVPCDFDIMRATLSLLQYPDRPTVIYNSDAVIECPDENNTSVHANVVHSHKPPGVSPSKYHPLPTSSLRSNCGLTMTRELAAEFVYLANSDAMPHDGRILDSRGEALDAYILDVRHFQDDSCRDGVSHQIIAGLSRPSGQKIMPTLLLYDERGLRLYDDITTEAQEYYLFGAEEEILKNHVDEIVRAMHSREGTESCQEEVILELGSGSLRKTSHILSGLSKLVPESKNPAPITYYALDLEERELSRSLVELAHSDVGEFLRGKVDLKGMLCTYDDGLKFIKDGGLQGREAFSTLSSIAPEKTGFMARDASPCSTTSTRSQTTEDREDTTAPSTPDNAQSPLHILFLGSSLGNFNRTEAIDFLLALPLRPGSGDTLLLGLDHDNDPKRIEEAYDDPNGFTKKFILNGLRAAGRALGDESMFNEDKWDYVGRYNQEERRHEAYYKSKSGQVLQDPSSKQELEFLADELVQIEVSYKFSEVDAYSLFASAKLRPIQRWTDSASQYSLWLLERPPFAFPLLRSPALCQSDSEEYIPFNVPSIQEWQDMWTAWDFVTLRMIPPTMLYQKPIDLRHICLFYLGHIPTFLDIHLSRLLQEPHTEPEEFKYIFERGIDPNVDDPTKCHPHSEVPQADEDWPSLNSILAFRSRVRARVQKLYEDIESGKRTMTRKIGRVLFMTFEHEGLHIETLLYMLLQRAGTGTLPPPGFTSPPWSSLSASWDSTPEPVSSTVTLGPATITLGHDDIEADDADPVKSLDVQTHEFGWDNESPKREVIVGEFKIEWRPVTNGQFFEFYNGAGKGKVETPATWVEVNGELQVRTLYGPVPMKTGWHWPVLTSYNNLSTYASVQGGRIPTEPELRLFMDKFESGYEGGANIGYRNWHLVPATAGGAKDGGKGHNGGVWEWTSTVFDKYEGFVPSALYPGYSADFFDGAHQTVLGGSHATIPRIGNRRSLRNWYQRNYPYAWVGARIAYDVEK